ncbi:uncharacterized protein FYW23_006721 isoform 2-T3 [Sylvia borin]
MGGGEGGLKWIARPGLVRGLDRRGLRLMAALGMCGAGPVEPHTGSGEYWLTVIPQALSFGHLPASLINMYQLCSPLLVASVQICHYMWRLNSTSSQGTWEVEPKAVTRLPWIEEFLCLLHE